MAYEIPFISLMNNLQEGVIQLLNSFPPPTRLDP